jgi:hypothetical protein
LIGVMTYAFARIGAVVAMKVEDYYPAGKRWWVRLHEKGGKRHEMPAHHKLEAFIDGYLAAAGIRDNGKTPLFRSAVGKTGVLTNKPMNRIDAYRMVATIGLFERNANNFKGTRNTKAQKSWSSRAEPRGSEGFSSEPPPREGTQF